MRGGPGDNGAKGRAHGGRDHDDDDDTRESNGLGAARVVDLGDGESTRADPEDEAALPVARPRSVRGRGLSGPPAVQIDAVEGERVPPLVVRRSAHEIHDPASRVGRALAAPGAVDLAALMGRPMGSPVADEPPSRRSLPAQDFAPSRSPAPDPASRRSLPAQDFAPSRSPAPEPSSRRSLPAQDFAPSRSPAPDAASRRSLPAQGAVDAPSSRISLPAEPSSRRSLPAQVGREGPSSRISLPAVGRDARPADEARDAAAAREVTHIDVAAAIGLAPEPRPLLPRIDDVADADDRTPPPRFALDLGRGAAPGGAAAAPASVSPRGGALVAVDEPRVPRPRLPTALDLRVPIPMPTRALQSPRVGSPWILVFAGALALGLVLLVVGTRPARGRPETAPVTAVASLAAQAPPPPEGAQGVRLVTRPARARVRVDGLELGLAPMLLRPRDTRAQYPLSVRAPGYKPWSGVLRLQGATVTIEPGDPPAPGAVVVTSDHDGPAVSVALEHE